MNEQKNFKTVFSLDDSIENIGKEVGVFEYKESNSNNSLIQSGKIPIDQIIKGNNVRKKYKGIEQLANSIEHSGLIQPIIVIKKRKGYLLIAGARRLRAFEHLGRSHIDAFIHNDIRDIETAQLLENLQRDNLIPADTEKGILTLLEKGHTQQKIADDLGMSKGWVSQISSSGKLRESFIKNIQLDSEREEKFDQIASTTVYEIFSKLKQDEQRYEALEKLIETDGTQNNAKTIIRKISETNNKVEENVFNIDNKIKLINKHIKELLDNIPIEELKTISSMLKKIIKNEYENKLNNIK